MMRNGANMLKIGNDDAENGLVHIKTHHIEYKFKN